MSEAGELNVYPGIDRQQYFFGRLGIIVVAIVAVMIFGPGSPVVRVVALALLIASLVLDVQRLKNIGLTFWWALIRFLPFGNLILGIGLQSAQPGWAETRQLDAAGKRILILNLALIAIILLLSLRRGMLVPMYV